MVRINRIQVLERLKSGQKLVMSGNTYLFRDGNSCTAETEIWLRDNKLVNVSGKIGRRILSWKPEV